MTVDSDDRYDLPAELWSKIIAFVLSHSIYIVCRAGQDVDLSWDQNAFGTLRLVSTSELTMLSRLPNCHSPFLSQCKYMVIEGRDAESLLFLDMPT